MVDKSTRIINQVADDREVKGGYTNCTNLHNCCLQEFSERTPFTAYHSGC
jgi:hypothetical protein